MTLGSHQRTIGKSQVHITPKWIIDELGPFDLDPCAADPRPWDCAKINIALPQDGLAETWRGHRVWLNPPFDRYQVGKWIRKLAAHGCGTALLHARTETDWFQIAWQTATAMLFLDNRIIFHKQDGSRQTTAKGQIANSGAPPVLVAFGNADAARLQSSSISGALVSGWALKGTKDGIALFRRPTCQPGVFRCAGAA